jgi:cupin 2 domain-containing protein
MKPIRVLGNLFDPVAGSLSEERIDILTQTETVRIERIVSRGHASPAGSWYDQSADEFVLLLAGRAVIKVADTEEPVSMGPGDTLLIPAHVKHRVEWTDGKEDTVWLAIHYPPAVLPSPPV